MHLRHLLLVPLTMLLAACPAPDEEREELPLPPAQEVPEGVVQGRVDADVSAPGWRVCAFSISGPAVQCTDIDGPSYSLTLPEGRYYLLAYGPGNVAGAHTASTTCLRDAAPDCTDGTLLEVEVSGGGALPAIDILDFRNQRPDWPDAP